MDEVTEKRSVPRYPVGDREHIEVYFEYKSQQYHGSLWDYSRFGLGVFLDDVHSPPERNSQVENIKITAFGDIKDLGAGRIARKHQESGSFYAGLILLDEFIDLDLLLHQRKIHLQQDEIQEMRKAIHDFSTLEKNFKCFASDFAAGLSVFKHKLDALDEKLKEETPAMRKNMFRVIENGIGAELHEFMDARLRELETIETRDQDLRELKGKYLRSLLWPFLQTAPFMERSNLKPRGYAGDSLMMEMVYEHGYRGRSTFGQLLHRHPLGRPSSQAIRNRRGLIIEELHSEIEDNALKAVNVLSVACGPAREMKDYISSSPYAARTELYLLDQDAEALEEARGSVVEGGWDLDSAPVHFLQESVRTLLRKTLPASLEGIDFHFIYTMGLFDYLTMPVSRALVTRLHSMLAPGGTIIVGNYTIKSPDRQYMDCLLDWPLIYKSEEDMLSMADQIPETTERSIGYEDSGVQMFLKLKKAR